MFDPAPTEPPTRSSEIDLSVVIATRDRAKQLAATLEHLAQMDAKGFTWEVVVVDNASRDETPETLRSMAQKLPLVALVEPTPGKNRALNCALNIVRGRLLAFIDDDILVGRSWAREIQAGAARWPKDSIFGGQIEPAWPARTPDWIRAPDFGFAAMAYGRYQPALTEGPVEQRPHGGNLIFRSTVFDGVRYNESIGPCGKSYVTGSESELLRRLTAHGQRFIYLPSIPVGHVVRADQTNLRWLYSRAFKFGRAIARFQQREDVRHLFGMPRYQLKRWCLSALRMAANSLGERRRAFEAGLQFFRLGGYLYEYRRLGKQFDKSSQEHLLPPNYGL